jgi:hypothetical protein
LILIDEERCVVRIHNSVEVVKYKLGAYAGIRNRRGSCDGCYRSSGIIPEYALLASLDSVPCVIASEAKQSHLTTGDGFVAPLLAMTTGFQKHYLNLYMMAAMMSRVW